MIYVVIPAHRPRLDDLIDCIRFADGRYLEYVVVTNDPTPIEPEDLSVLGLETEDRIQIVKDTEDDINLARWYNIGVDWAQGNQQYVSRDEPIAIFYMESDVRISYPSILALEEEMHHHAVSQIGPNFWDLPEGHMGLGTRTTLEYVYPPYRVCQASMVPIHSSHRMDERFRWWMESDDLEWKCKMDRGSRLSQVPATHPGTLFHAMPPELTEKTVESTERFKKKWGKTPWEQ